MTSAPITPTTTAAARPALPLQAADLQGLAQLLTDGSLGVLNVVEGLHHTIVQRTGLPGLTGFTGRSPLADAATPHDAPSHGPTRGLTGLVYRSVRGGMRLTGRGLDAVLGTVAALAPGGGTSPGREAALAALNGLWGDHLEARGNPLAITSRLRSGGVPLTLERAALAQRFPQAGPRLLVLAHGLCMNDLQWQRNGHNHGQALAQALGFSPVYLHANSGRHVSHNGRDLALLLDALVAQWPVPVTEVVIVGHSMGGLIARSACHVAQQQGLAWLSRLRALVFLGTPHHGAPLERGGQFVDKLLGVSPYVAPFARLGQARSAGITDLRFGNVQDADWQGRDRHTQRHDDRQPTPLPAGVSAFAVAATTADQVGSLRSHLLGDGLVRIGSALGHHRNPALALGLPARHTRVVTRANHWDLLDHVEVNAQLQRWLGDLER